MVKKFFSWCIMIIALSLFCACNKCEGKFYSLKEAYEFGWITQEDLMSIAYYHNDGCLYNEEIMGNVYNPKPKMPDVLNAETEKKIKSSAAEEYRKAHHNKTATKDGFTIVEYYGTYNDCIAVMMQDVYSGEMGIVWTDKIADVNFYYNGGKTIKIWRNLE